MKLTQRNIEEYIDRFMAGETTNDEERAIYRFFREEKVRSIDQSGLHCIVVIQSFPVGAELPSCHFYCRIKGQQQHFVTAGIEKCPLGGRLMLQTRLKRHMFFYHSGQFI